MHFPSSPQPRPLSLSLSLPKKNINPPPFHTQATAALERQEVPIGCVLVDESGRVVAKGSNRTNEKRDVRVCAFFSFWFSSLPSFLSSLFSFVFFLSHTPPLAKKLKKKKTKTGDPPRRARGLRRVAGLGLREGGGRPGSHRRERRELRRRGRRRRRRARQRRRRQGRRRTTRRKRRP